MTATPSMTTLTLDCSDAEALGATTEGGLLR